jgi:hypothetical protein
MWCNTTVTVSKPSRILVTLDETNLWRRVFSSFFLRCLELILLNCFEPLEHIGYNRTRYCYFCFSANFFVWIILGCRVTWHTSALQPTTFGLITFWQCFGTARNLLFLRWVGNIQPNSLIFCFSCNKHLTSGLLYKLPIRFVDCSTKTNLLPNMMAKISGRNVYYAMLPLWHRYPQANQPKDICQFRTAYHAFLYRRWLAKNSPQFAYRMVFNFLSKVWSVTVNVSPSSVMVYVPKFHHVPLWLLASALITLLTATRKDIKPKVSTYGSNKSIHVLSTNFKPSRWCIVKYWSHRCENFF